MAKKKKEKKSEKKPEVAEEWDLEEGFGGIPDDVDLTKNIGCASNNKKKG
ncbi:hypothetical protein GCM10007049_10870 [Echinicola pacifica]|uniref:Uncharacterized protein n=1 Tax=Echinicola pacifica TaxID=346377 RepID=A0A918PSX3_9BACT|nr:hypothetical protein [Echinicola pacifica]GGZ20148.1 hypothetical protein GCM10007049_10870 [Echinicola pacifica]